MSRVTRSKKVDILQDDTELDTQISRSQTPAAEHRNILSEINLRMGLNTMEDPNVAQELKGLKAAYRATLGIAKRGRKKAVKRKDKQGLVVGTEEIVEDIQIPDKGTTNEFPEQFFQGTIAPWLGLLLTSIDCLAIKLI